MKFKILSVPSNLLRYLLKLKKTADPFAIPLFHLFEFESNQGRQKARKFERSHVMPPRSNDFNPSVRPVGFFPRFPYRGLAKNLLATSCIPGERIPGSAHNRASKDSREFRAVAPSRREHSRFQLLLRGGIKKWAALWM